MSDWEDEYDAGGVAISKPLPVETLPVKSWRPPSPRGARSRETTSVGAKFGGDASNGETGGTETLNPMFVTEQPINITVTVVPGLDLQGVAVVKTDQAHHRRLSMWKTLWSGE